MKMKRMLSLGLSLLMCATLITGCSNNSSTSSNESKTLKIAGLDGGYGTKVGKKLLKSLKKKQVLK